MPSDGSDGCFTVADVAIVFHWANKASARFTANGSLVAAALAADSRSCNRVSNVISSLLSLLPLVEEAVVVNKKHRRRQPRVDPDDDDDAIENPLVKKAQESGVTSSSFNKGVRMFHLFNGCLFSSGYFRRVPW